MVVEGHDRASGDSHYFQVNFPARHGTDYQFMWMDGRRRVLEVRHVDAVPAGATVEQATFDVPSHEIIVQTGR